jgi:hypothetical protein
MPEVCWFKLSRHFGVVHCGVVVCLGIGGRDFADGLGLKFANSILNPFLSGTATPPDRAPLVVVIAAVRCGLVVGRIPSQLKISKPHLLVCHLNQHFASDSSQA